ncbi:MAG TPA: nuclear transport factor 2 family protein [Acidimicrobiia bacterium]|nr:nuclear transport factor 2 family protein [Acidimicrobiia bacterium]
MAQPSIRQLVEGLYPALLAGDRPAIERLVAEDFTGTLTDGLPLEIGGVHQGRERMIEDGWWAFGRNFSLRVEPSDWIDCDGGRLLVLGRYVGRARSTGAPVDAAFAHLWTARDGRLCAVWQLTDSARFVTALQCAGAGAPGQNP